MVRITRRYTTFRNDSALETWVFRIVQRVAFKVVRRNARDLDLLSRYRDHLMQNGHSDDEHVESIAMAEFNEFVDLLTVEIDKLPTRQRDVMRLLLQNASPSQIARALGITTVNVHVTIHSARRCLMERLVENDNEFALALATQQPKPAAKRTSK